MSMKKLAKKDQERLWGDSGPYSQVNMTIQTRILDERINRVFLIVQVDVNPLTFELTKRHQQKFKDDAMIQNFLEVGEYRGDQLGYVVFPFEEEFADNGVMDKGHQILIVATNALIKMHTFVMEELGLPIKGISFEEWASKSSRWYKP